MKKVNPVFKRYTVDEVITIIEEYSKLWLEKESVEIKVTMKQNEKVFLFEVRNVDKEILIYNYTIKKTEPEQEYLYSIIDFIGTSLHEVIECVHQESSNLFVHIKKVKDKESTQFFLESLERRKETGEISHENYEWYKKTVQTLRLRNLVS